MIKPPSTTIDNIPQIAVMFDTYTHVLLALQREAADAMDRALGASLER